MADVEKRTKEQRELPVEQIEHKNQSSLQPQQQQQQQQQQQPTTEVQEVNHQNDCVYIECTPMIEISQESSQKFDNFTSIAQAQVPQLTHINYSLQPTNHIHSINRNKPIGMVSQQSCETVPRGLLRFIDNNMFHQEPPASTVKDIKHIHSIGNYNLQPVEQVQIYNGTYTMPLQQIQQSNVIQNQVIQSQMQVPSHTQQQFVQTEDQQPFVQQPQIVTTVSESKEKPVKSTKLKKDNDVDILNKQCPTCYKTFETAAKLSRHVKTHSSDMPYRCKICNKAFSHSGNYKIHLRMHTDERPFVCTVCNKGCRQAQDLEKHMRTHTGLLCRND